MINNLANDMLRLRNEIAALRDDRSTLMTNLAEASESLRLDVSQLLVGFGKARAEMSQQTKAELCNSILQVKETVTGLRQSVLELRRSFQNDITGARQTWCKAGAAAMEEPSPVAPAPKAKKKKR